MVWGIMSLTVIYSCRNLFRNKFSQLIRGPTCYLSSQTPPSGSRVSPEDHRELPSSEDLTSDGRNHKISKAMKAYLEKAKKHNEFMAEKQIEFDLGKRHLANIMGWDPEMITQKDINEAIEYLLPSGLFNPPARPMMKPPEEIYPKRKAPQFDMTGRPFHYLFYTSKPQFYDLMHDIHSHYLALNAFEDKMIGSGMTMEAKVDLSGSQWLSLIELKSLLLERVNEQEYEYMIQSMEKLAEHPYSARIKQFFMMYRKELTTLTSTMEIKPLTYTPEDNRPYVEAEGLRKHCKAQVRLYGNGSGKIEINGQDITYFDYFKDREQVMFPLQFTGLLFKVDVVARVEGVGTAAHAGAIRHAISHCLKSFVDPETVEDLRLAGLLTKDRRVRERKKYGQWKARKKFKWLKR